MIELKWYNGLKILVNWIVDNAEYLMVRATTLLAPVPSAWALYLAFEPKAGWWAVGLAVVIEFMGLGAGELIARVDAFNKQYAQRRLPDWVGWSVFSTYLLIVLFVIGAYETIPIWINQETNWPQAVQATVPLSFPFLTLVGAVLIGLRNHMQRVKDEDAHKGEIIEKRDNTLFEIDLDERKRTFDQKLEIDRIRAISKIDNRVQKTVQRTVQNANPDPMNTPVAQPDIEHRRTQVLHSVEQGNLNVSGLAKKYNTDRSSIYNDLKVLAGQGKVHSNIQGWKPGPSV